MKIGVLMDMDGHFVVVPIKKREEIVEALKTFDGGDYWANEMNHLNWRFLIAGADPEHWEDNLQQFTQRGTFEILDLET